MQVDEVYGFAHDEDVADLINARFEYIIDDGELAIKKMLREAVIALLEINSTIPVNAKHRHLVAQALESFADGSSA